MQTTKKIFLHPPGAPALTRSIHTKSGAHYPSQEPDQVYHLIFTRWIQHSTHVRRSFFCGGLVEVGKINAIRQSQALPSCRRSVNRKYAIIVMWPSTHARVTLLDWWKSANSRLTESCKAFSCATSWSSVVSMELTSATLENYFVSYHFWFRSAWEMYSFYQVREWSQRT